MSKTQFSIIRAERKVVMDRIFAAPRDRVWQTITDPQLIPQWWGPNQYETVVDEMDLSVGGRWRFRNIGANGDEHAFHGTYLEIDPPYRLVQTFNYEPIGPGHESVETATLEALGNDQTRMTMVSVAGSLEDLDGMVASGMEGGARETWERLANLLEREVTHE
ncbi:MAG: SRPBCC family protein [Anaerolineales bacterium]|nr:SRPBCC family protein [Anaerolineales bacterium]